MNPVVIIPARMAATRLPGKPLADIGGVAMIVRVLRQAQLAGIGPVAVAAGDQAIVEAVREAGGTAVLTDPALPSGSDRVLAALQAIDPEGAHDAVINLQGDMPFVEPSTVAACARVLERHPDADVSTLVAGEASAADRSNSDVVKAVLALTSGQDSGRRSISPAPPSMAKGRSGGIWGSMAIAARRSSGSAQRRPRRWSSGKSWSNCAVWKWAWPIMRPW